MSLINVGNNKVCRWYIADNWVLHTKTFSYWISKRQWGLAQEGRKLLTYPVLKNKPQNVSPLKYNHNNNMMTKLWKPTTFWHSVLHKLQIEHGSFFTVQLFYELLSFCCRFTCIFHILVLSCTKSLPEHQRTYTHSCYKTIKFRVRNFVLGNIYFQPLQQPTRYGTQL